MASVRETTLLVGVRAMSVYSVESVLSFNSADFKRYDLVTALDPASLLDGVC
jgi:hypothetical protein